jgi:hypothetical protein
VHCGFVFYQAVELGTYISQATGDHKAPATTSRHASLYNPQYTQRHRMAVGLTMGRWSQVAGCSRDSGD